MKVLRIALLFFVGLTISSIAFAESQFCKGFEQGYITGHKQASGGGFDPFTPFCPFQPFKNYNDPDSDFEHGYIIGYELGKEEGSH